MAGCGACSRGGGGMWYGVRHIAWMGTCDMVWGHVAGCGSMWQGVRSCGRGGGMSQGIGAFGRGWGGDMWQGVGACGRWRWYVAGCGVIWQGVEACHKGKGHMARAYVKCQKVKDVHYE